MYARHAPDAKLKVELPGGHVLGKVALFVCEGDADLDKLEEIDVAAHGLVVVVG